MARKRMVTQITLKEITLRIKSNPTSFGLLAHEETNLIGQVITEIWIETETEKLYVVIRNILGESSVLVIE